MVTSLKVFSRKFLKHFWSLNGESVFTKLPQRLAFFLFNCDWCELWMNNASSFLLLLLMVLTTAYDCLIFLISHIFIDWKDIRIELCLCNANLAQNPQSGIRYHDYGCAWILRTGSIRVYSQVSILLRHGLWKRKQNFCEFKQHRSQTVRVSTGQSSMI